MKIIPKDKWILFSHQIILHGRALHRAKTELRGMRAGSAVLRQRQNAGPGSLIQRLTFPRS